jgi:CMP-N-acetylneuraminic acid synthetase
MIPSQDSSNIKISIIIPAKGNSTRLKNKNMLPLKGKSLVYRACEKCLQSKYIDNVYIDTESDVILKDVETLVDIGLKVIKRPIELSTNKTSGNDLIAFEQTQIEECDLVLHTYATSPLITIDTIDNCIEQFISNYSTYDSFFSAIHCQEYIWDGDSPLNFLLEDLPNSIDLPKLMVETHGIYGIKYTSLSKLKRRLGNKVLPIEIPRIQSLDINNYEEFKLTEILWNKV